MDDFWDLGSQFASPAWYNLAGCSYPHAHQDAFQRPSARYRDPEEFYNPAGFTRPASAYRSHQPPPRRTQYSPDPFSRALSPSYEPRRSQYSHLHETDPGYLDLRFLPGFQYHSLGPRSGYLTQQQEPAGMYGRSEHASPNRAQPKSRQVAVEDNDSAETGISGLPFTFARTNPGVRRSQPASHRSHAASESDDADQADDLESEQQRLLFLREQQQLKERRLRQQKEQQEEERRAAKEAQERRFRERVEQLIAQDERRADDERERRQAQQLQEQRLQQQLQYQRLREQELWHQQQEHYEAQRQQRAQLQQQQQQRLRQQQRAEREAEAHRQEQEEQERYIAQQQLLLREQQQRRQRARQAEADSQLRQPSASQAGKAQSSGTAKAQQSRQQAGTLPADQLHQKQSTDAQQQHHAASGVFADRLQQQQGQQQQGQQQQGDRQQQRQPGGLTAEQLQQENFSELYRRWSQSEQAKHHRAAQAQQPHSPSGGSQQPRMNQHPRESQQQEEARIVEQLESKASLKPVDAAVIIQKLLRGQRLRAERPLLEKLLQANSKLNSVASRLEEVTECIDALRDLESSQPVAKLKHSQGQLASPEQLQKQLLELSELSMQVVLSMDDLHSEAREVRSLRKRSVKRSLALMEKIDNARAGMLRSVMDTHPHDDQSEFSNFESDSDAVSTDHQHPGGNTEDAKGQKQRADGGAEVPSQLSAEEKSDELVTNAQLNLGEAEEPVPNEAEQQDQSADGPQDTLVAANVQNGGAVNAEQSKK